MATTNALADRVAEVMGRRRAATRQSHAGWVSRDREDHHGEWLAKGLGWFSVGLGLTQILMPRDFARLIGVEDRAEDSTTIRLVGLRELTCGMGILSRRRPAGWVWARVAGDVMDLALLGKALVSEPKCPERVAGATLTLAGVTALDAYGAYQLSRRVDGTAPSWLGGPFEARGSITIQRPPEEIYHFWRDPRNLPRFMTQLESVELTGDRRSHWRAKAPGGKTIEWDSEVVDDRPNERISWRTIGDSDMDHSGSVRFVRAPGGRGTEVHVEMYYDPPGGPFGALIAKLFGAAPEQQLSTDLLHLKQLMEVGEIVLSEGAGDGSLIVQRPAQPLPGGSSR